jgi:hypothetical protein
MPVDVIVAVSTDVVPLVDDQGPKAIHFLWLFQKARPFSRSNNIILYIFNSLAFLEKR